MEWPSRASSDGDTAALTWRDVLAGADITVTYEVGDGSTTSVKSATVLTKAAGSYIMNSVVEAGSGSDPAEDWNSVAFGDQA